MYTYEDEYSDSISLSEKMIAKKRKRSPTIKRDDRKKASDSKITKYFKNSKQTKLLTKNIAENNKFIKVFDLSAKTKNFIEAFRSKHFTIKEEVELNTLCRPSMRERYGNLITRKDFILPSHYELLYLQFVELEDQLSKGKKNFMEEDMQNICKFLKVIPNCYSISKTKHRIDFGHSLSMERRKATFRERLVKMVKNEHEKFIKKKGLSLDILPKLYAEKIWFSEFNLEDCPDILG